MSEKKELTSEQLYRRNKKKAKVFNTLAPVVKWVFLLVAVVFFVLAIHNSIGNVTEILHLLDKDIYTGEEIAQHYKMLVEKWGEWEIVGADAAGLVIRYVDIRNALFSGFLAVGYCARENSISAVCESFRQQQRRIGGRSNAEKRAEDRRNVEEKQ